MAETALRLPLQMDRTLLCMNMPASARAVIQGMGYTVEVGSISAPINTRSLGRADIVVLDVTSGGEEVVELARRLRTAMCIAGSTGRILCFSAIHRSPRFVLVLQNCGARYVRISDTSMLLEAIELLVAEIAELERNRPCFRITHRFSQGTCAPGEEIEIIECAHNGDFLQLPLALSARFVFNCLAENRSHALDAFQIASTLSAGWFYRDHAKNSGVRQTTKVRVATIKVLIQRIRKAMTSVFAGMGLTYNPYDVVQSFPAEGSKRALYRLNNATVKWNHILP